MGNESNLPVKRTFSAPVNVPPKQGFNSGTIKPIAVSNLPAQTARVPGTPKNQLKLFVEKELDKDGIEMGVLSDGTAFLTGRGLGRICGVHSARISELSQNWDKVSTNAMAEGVKSILAGKRLSLPSPYIEADNKGSVVHAYPDYVCLAVLEYYAFDYAGPNPAEVAKKNFRTLAGKALRDFIYAQLRYDPSQQVSPAWRQFHDRVSLAYNAVPPGYFSIFKEIADIVVHLGLSGLTIDEKFIPDISVGQLWSKHWSAKGLDAKFGERKKYDHNYPEYFPQSASNPQDCWCYPEMALGEFRRWVREDYIGGGRFERYLDGQVAKRELPPSFAQLAVAAYQPKQLP